MVNGATASSIGHLIDRPRVIARLLGRFQHRLTLVIGSAGSGKTSALTRAIESNTLDPRGVDVLVSFDRSSNDALQFLTKIAGAIGVPADSANSADDVHQPIIDWAWSQAPEDVAIVLDDAHFITDPAALDALARLLDDLPANGHLVIAARSTPRLATARLRSHGEVLEISDAELGFDDVELEGLRAARRGRPDADLPRHPATADLQLAAAQNASIDFLQEEVLAALDADRLNALQRMSVFEEFDEECVGIVTDGAFESSALLGGLPLVESRSDGSFRLHAILREALASQQTEAERRKASSVAGALLLERNQFAASIRLHLEAHDEISARDAAREFVLSPILQQAQPELAAVRRLIDTFDGDGPLRQLFDAMLHLGGRYHLAAERFEAAALSAQEAGDEVLESVALYRLLQAHFLDGDEDGPHMRYFGRLKELSATVPFARGVVATTKSQIAQHHGDSQGALEPLDDCRHLGPVFEMVIRNQRLCDLGRPEQVGVGLTPADLASLPPGSEVFIAFGMWLRGEAPPEFANDFVGAMLPAMVRRDLDHATISTLGVATSVALAAGDTQEAARRARHARDLADRDAPRTIALFADVAAASVAADQDSDEAAALLLAPEVAALPIVAWTHRAHLLALPLLYVVRPETRPTLDRNAFGPSLSTAVSAGQALVALRELNDSGPASRLPWTQTNLLRVHVLPHHLTELACAAQAAGVADAAVVLEQIPQLERHLTRLAGGISTDASRHAERLIGSRPRVAPHLLMARMLGDVALERDGILVADGDWTRRPRLREMLACLIDRGPTTRTDLIALLWPDYDDDRKANSNLRAHLSKLQGVLEPEREVGSDPYFLRIDGESLVLHGDVHNDVADFERLIERARLSDESGLPASALEGYAEAAELFRGDYLQGFDTGWAVLTRFRLRSLALSATCRVAELTGARGLPEEATRWADRAIRIDGSSERAARIFVASLLATGDRSGARSAATEFATMFRDLDVRIESSTQRLFDRVR